MQINPLNLFGRSKENEPAASMKVSFLMLCAILGAIYIAFSFVLNAYADPPTSPYTPGETLAPTCSPTSTNCTVIPALYGTSTLPQGGLLFINDTSGTVTAATGSLWWNNAAGQLKVGNIPQQTPTGTILLLGNGLVQNGNVSGTMLASNPSSTFGGDFVNFEVNSSSVFRVASSGALTINETTGTKITTSIAPLNDLFNISNSTATAINTAGVNALSIYYVGGAGTGGIEAAAQRIDLTAGSSGTWDGIRLVGQSSTFAGVNENAIKIDSLANPGPGVETGIQIGSNWDAALAILGGPTQVSATAKLWLGNLLQGGNVSGTFFSINASTTSNADLINFEVNSSSIFKVGSSSALTITASGTTAFVLTGSPQRSATVSLLQLGPNAIAGGGTTGTFIGANPTQSSTFSDFINFQENGKPVFRVSATGRMEVGPATTTAAFWGATTTLTVCAQNNCTGTGASSTNAVAWFASTGGLATDMSIAAHGVITGGLADVGEFIPIMGDASEYGQGDVVSIAESSTPAFYKTSTPYDPALAGVITTTAGLVAGGGQDNPGTTIIALAGRIPVNVTMENGPIHIGDFLTSSDIPGIAMRATQPGRVLGMALADDFGDPNAPNATSQVMMFVNVGWSLGNLTSTGEIASSSWALEITNSGTQVVIDQFTAYVQAALAKLGIAIQDGIITLQQIIADKVTTNVLCVQGVCVDGNQLSNLLNNSGQGGGSGDSTPPAAVPPPPAPASGGSSSTDPTAPSGSGSDSSSTPPTPPPTPPTPPAPTPPPAPASGGSGSSSSSDPGSGGLPSGGGSDNSGGNASST